MKGQDKNSRKTNEVEIGNLPDKELRIMIENMIQNLGKRMEAKIARNLYQRPTTTKKQTAMNSTTRRNPQQNN